MIQLNYFLLFIILICQSTSFSWKEVLLCQKYFQSYSSVHCKPGSECQKQINEQCNEKLKYSKDCRYYRQKFNFIGYEPTNESEEEELTPQYQKDIFYSRFATTNDNDKKELDDLFNEYEIIYKDWQIDQQNKQKYDALSEQHHKIMSQYSSMLERLDMNEDLRKSWLSCEQQCLSSLTDSDTIKGFTFYVDCVKGDIEQAIVIQTINQHYEQMMQQYRQ